MENIEPEWYQKIRDFAVLVEEYNTRAEELAEYMVSVFPTRTAFEKNNKEIKKVISMGLSPHEFQILADTDSLLHTVRTPEENLLWQKREILQKRVRRVYVRMRDDIYGRTTLNDSKNGIIVCLLL